MAGITVYVDSSVLVRRLLRQPTAIHDWSSWDTMIASELTRIEARRTLFRMQFRGLLSSVELSRGMLKLDEYARGIDQIELSGAILSRASGPLPGPLGTLDAIHLATALEWAERNGAVDLIFGTHDRTLADAARSCGFDVRP